MTLCYQVNVVKGLKIYEDVFTTMELMKVADFINEIRQAGRNGELSGKLCFVALKFFPSLNVQTLEHLGIVFCGAIYLPTYFLFTFLSGYFCCAHKTTTTSDTIQLML